MTSNQFERGFRLIAMLRLSAFFLLQEIIILQTDDAF